MLSISAMWGKEIDLDYATFYGDENTGIVEVYINVPRTLFTFVENEGIYESNIFFRVALIQNDSIVAFDEWHVRDKKYSEDNDSIKNQKIPEISVLQAKPGLYKLTIYTFDLNSEEKYKKSMDIELYDYSIESLKISDVQLGLQMGKTDKKNKFSKYFGFDILPNASRIFTEGHLTIFPFCEIYNMEFKEGETNTYQVKYSVYGLNGKEVKVLKEIVKKKPGASAVEVDHNGMDISDIGSGSYIFHVEVCDIQTGKTAIKGKKFYIIRTNEGEYLTSEKDLQEYYNELTEKELDEKFGPLAYIATNLEKVQYKKSDVVGKRNILNNFWKTRDPNVDTKANESYVKFVRLFQKAESAFKNGFRKGWRSDRGRILIKYGEPDEIERHPSSIDKKPYNIWYYNEIEGGVQFIFVDKTGFGDMELVHSTARNEMQNPDWERMLD